MFLLKICFLINYKSNGTVNENYLMVNMIYTSSWQWNLKMIFIWEQLTYNIENNGNTFFKIDFF